MTMKDPGARNRRLAAEEAARTAYGPAAEVEAPPKRGKKAEAAEEKTEEE